MGRPKGTGRPLKLTVEIIDRICRHVAAGLSRNRAADLVGIHRMTIQRWVKLGKSSGGSKLHASFVAKLAESEAQFIEENVKAVRKAATPRTSKVIKRTVRNTYDLAGKQTGTSEVIEETTKRELDWGAARWLLECKDRESFGPDRHEIAALKKDMAELRKLLAEAIRVKGQQDDERPAGGQTVVQAGGSVQPAAGTPDSGGVGNPPADPPADGPTVGG